MTNEPQRTRQQVRDLWTLSVRGLISRPLRTALTAMGIAIGIASMILVVGLSSSSRADVVSQLDALGTNVLKLRAANGLGDGDARLPAEAVSSLGRIPTVESVASVAAVEADVRRNEHDDTPNAVTPVAVDETDLELLGAQPAHGRLTQGDEQELPIAMLGSVAAERLGVRDLSARPTVEIGGVQFAVGAVLEPMPLHPDLDRSALIGRGAAENLLEADLDPTGIYLTVDREWIDETRSILARTANPAAPGLVEVSRPSDALEARSKVDAGFRNLMLALGGVALVVAGVGIANVMVISVIERRAEIGLRRALGARPVHIVAQFLGESSLVSLLGGTSGVLIGGAATAFYASRRGWQLALPTEAIIGGVVASLIVGLLAGLQPAYRAARLDPAVAARPA